MSLLSDTQGRPHTVRALILTMRSLGGSVPDGDLTRWLRPEGFAARDEGASKTRVQQVLGCARSLEWVKSDGGTHTLVADVPAHPDGFLDYLHGTLCATDKVEDRRILEAYAALLVRTEAERSTEWLRTFTLKQLGDLLDEALRLETDQNRAFNDTKIPAWREWLEAIGLGRFSATAKQFLPDPTPRILRELGPLRDQFGGDIEIPPQEFLRSLARRMPYLDGGSMLEEVSKRMRQPLAADQMSLVLARALRELELDGVIRLEVRGDAAVQGVRIPALTPWPAQLIVGITLCGARN